MNDHEVGRIVRFAIDHPAVRGINFQPAFNAGRHGAPDPMERATIPDVTRWIEEQTDGLFRRSDFVPIPCCFPTCNAVTYGYLEEDGGVMPLPRMIEVDDYLDYITNRAVPGVSDGLRAALEGLWSSAALPGSPRSFDGLALSCVTCDLPSLSASELSRHFIMIMLQDFMDPWTFNQKNVMKCCKEILLPDGKQIPFCAYNSVGYREQATVQLTAGQRNRAQARRSGAPYVTPPLHFDFSANRTVSS